MNFDDIPEPPPSVTAIPRMRYWGDRKPPKNRADMFRVVTAAATDEPGESASTTGPIATIRMYGPIDSWGGWWGISARDVAEALDSLSDASEIRVRINSPGGEVWEGMAILNMLRAHPAKIVAVVDGLAASAASVVAVGCDETVMSPGTQMMVHDASGFAYGNAATMLKAARWLNSTSDSIASVYAEAAGGTDESWRAVMQEETWYTAKEAVEANLADRVAVVSDAGETTTAGDDTEPVIDDIEDHFDLSMYQHAGRSKAPAPAAVAAPPQTPSAEPVAQQHPTPTLEVTVADDAATPPVAPGSDESPPTTTAPAASAAGPDQLAEISRLSAEVTALRAESAAREKAEFLDTACAQGQITPAERGKAATADEPATGFEAMYDKAPDETRAFINARAIGSMVPVASIGHEGDGAENLSLEAELDAWANALDIPREALR